MPTTVCRLLLFTLLWTVGFSAAAQPAKKVARIGYLAAVSDDAQPGRQFQPEADRRTGHGKGARPAELPIQQPTKFEMVINLKTAGRTA